MKKSFHALMIVAAFVMAGVAVSPASASTDYEQGLAMGQQKAQERIEQLGDSFMSYTGPAGLILTFLKVHEKDAMKCLESGCSEEYKQGFMEGFAAHIGKCQKDCMKGIDCYRADRNLARIR